MDVGARKKRKLVLEAVFAKFDDPAIWNDLYTYLDAIGFFE